MTNEKIGGVVKVIELVGSSPHSFSDAVRNAVKTASQSIRHITGVEALASTAEVGEDGELVNYKVQCKIAFLVEKSVDEEGEAAAQSASAPVATASTSAAGARGASPGPR